jgi:radical SAM protein with 4Fe4S-binding SPASM domain
MMIHSGRAIGNASELNVTPEEAKNVFSKLCEIDRKEFGYFWVPKPPYVAGDCDMLHKHVVIDSCGNIKPCFGFVDSVGNMRSISIAGALRDPAMKKLRNIEANLEGKCSKCAHKSSCYGCRCEMNLCGKTFAAYASCWV